MTSLTEIAPPLGRDTASSAVESDFAVSLSIPLPSFCDKELTVWYSFIVRLKASATSDECSQTTTGYDKETLNTYKVRCDKHSPLCSGALLQHSSTLWGKQLNPRMTLLIIPGVPSLFDSLSPLPASMPLLLLMVLSAVIFLVLFSSDGIAVKKPVDSSTQVDRAGRMLVIGVDMCGRSPS